MALEGEGEERESSGSGREEAQLRKILADTIAQCQHLEKRLALQVCVCVCVSVCLCLRGWCWY